MPLRSYLPSFADELSKIATAGDLMTPAVVSDSATVDGPPATPFTRRKGFKKLEVTLPKEASKKINIHNLFGKPKKLVERAAIESYEKMPRAAKNTLHQVARNPGEWASTPNTLAMLARAFGAG